MNWMLMIIYVSATWTMCYFLQFEEFELYWGAVFLYESKSSIGEVLFLINFIGVNFEAGNETREKIWSDFGAEKK